MKLKKFLPKKPIYFIFIAFFSFSVSVQSQDTQNKFWDNVRYGGGAGFSAGNGFFSGSLAPSAIYDFNQYFSAGVGLQGSYAKANNYTASTYGGSFLAFLRPLQKLRLSAELELLQVNMKRERPSGNVSRNYLYPGLFLGAGYRSGPVTFGLRYDVLYNDDRSIYGSPIMPFVSVYF